MEDQKIKPSRWLYVLAIVLALAGIIIFVFLIFSTVFGMSKGLTQIIVPGSGQINIAKPGEYTIFYEYQSVVDNRIYSTREDLSGLQCHVIQKSTGNVISISPTKTSSNYSFGSRAGKGLFTFSVSTPGIYIIEADYATEEQGPDVVLAVGKDITMNLIGTIFGGFAILFVSLILAAIIAIVTFMKRRKSTD